VKILCDVDQVECLRHGVDAPSSTIEVEVDPKSLTEEQRNFVASQLYDGLRFPNSPGSEICPPTYEGFIAAVNYGLEKDKIGSRHTVDEALQDSPDLMKEKSKLQDVPGPSGPLRNFLAEVRSEILSEQRSQRRV
jgi:hypothetical protein